MNNRIFLMIFILKAIYFRCLYNFSDKYLNAPEMFYKYYHTQKIDVRSKNFIRKKFVILDQGSKHNNKFFRSLFKIDHLEKNDKEIRQQEISDLLRQMKMSGYFENISIKSEIVNKQQTITITCKSMSPIQSITVINNRDIMMPQKMILGLFKKQLNKPQNFRLISNALKEIYKWYYKKGYQWISITIKQDSRSTIELQIAEGIIDSIQFKIVSSNTESRTSTNISILQNVRNFLDIRENSRLNYNDIETKLDELKKKRIFANCDYTVLQSKKDPTKLDIFISIYELADKKTSLLGQNNSFSASVVETIESQIFNSINSLFKASNYQIKKTKEIKRFNCIKTLSRIPLYSYNDQGIVNEIVTKQKAFLLSDLYEWYANPVHFINSNNLSIDHNIQNIGKHKEFVKIRFKIPSLYKNFMLIYCKPWITFCKQQSSLVQIKILQQSFYADEKKITEWFNQVFNHKFIFLDSLSTVKAFKAKLKTKLGNNWRLKQTLGIESISNKKTSTKRQPEFLFGHTSNYLAQSKINSQIFICSRSQQFNDTSYNFMSIDTKLKYRFNHNYDIDWSATGNNFAILSRYSLPLNSDFRYKLSNYYKKFSQRGLLKYTSYKHYDILRQKRFFSKHFLFIDLELGNLIGSSTFFPWMEKFEIKFPDSITRNKSIIPNFPKLFYKARCEYHLGSPESYSLFFFCNYISTDERNVFYRNNEMLSQMSRNADDRRRDTQLYGGIGCQIKTSIRYLPPIRIECNICRKSETRIYFRIVEVLSSVAIHKQS
nr:hypothetical protein [Porphyrostromium boryanum]